MAYSKTYSINNTPQVIARSERSERRGNLNPVNPVNPVKNILPLFTMLDLCQNPLCKPEHLGLPIPDSSHAVSVALPLWQHVIGYEEKDPDVINAMTCGYPRFFCHPFVLELFDRCQTRFANKDQASLAFPSKRAAELCLEYIQLKKNLTGKIDPFGQNNIHVATFPNSALETAKDFWRYSGLIVSSRLARNTLDDISPSPTDQKAKEIILNRLAQLYHVNNGDIYLYPSGMAATHAAQLAILKIAPNTKSAQLGFPYVDVLRIQKEIGPGVTFLHQADDHDLNELETQLASKQVAAVFTELPSNPLMRTTDVPRLSELTRKHHAPLVIDDTIGTCYNINVLGLCDLLTTSLTKFFSGVGDVMAGSLLVNPDSPLHDQFRDTLLETYDDCLWPTDAAVLERNSRDFPQRMEKINNTTLTLVDSLKNHPKIDNLYFPTTQTPQQYLNIKKPKGQFGGLFSILLKNPQTSAPIFYDHLTCCKGPSLGTNYTLVCPYTLLAHYEELNWAEQCGISRHLIRISVGLEEPNDLIQRFKSALDTI
ncbi:MAG: PLP-dependent transferase [Planctomycetes bacterium]|nr:PLP-dependent transferase [Planctomycetota bacterium]